MLYWGIISSSLFLCLILVGSINSFEMQLKPQKIENDTHLHGLTELLHNIPFNLPTINLCIGTPGQCFNLALSTTNGFSVIESIDSKELIFNNQFDYKKSLTYIPAIKNKNIGVFLMGIKYYYLDGLITEDHLTIPIDKSKSSIPFKFVLAQANHKYPHINFDGFIGMQKIFTDSLYFCQTDMSLMKYLKRSDYISKENFVMEYNQEGGGRIVFGEEENYSQYKTCKSTSVKYFQFKWDCSITEISIGDNVFQGRKRSIVTFESNKSFIYAPDSLGGNFVIEYLLQKSLSYCGLIKDRNNTVIICDEGTDIASIPNLILRLNETELVIQWSNVFKITTINGVKKYIGAFIVGNSQDYLNYDHWVIGIPGFIDNSILFDYDENRIGIKFNSTGHLKNKSIQLTISSKLRPLFITVCLIMSLGIGLLVFVNVKIIKLK